MSIGKSILLDLGVKEANGNCSRLKHVTLHSFSDKCVLRGHHLCPSHWVQSTGNRGQLCGVPRDWANVCAGLHVAVVDYKWNQHGRIVDIGGAYGSFLASILAKHAAPQGLLFDQCQASPWPSCNDHSPPDKELHPCHCSSSEMAPYWPESWQSMLSLHWACSHRLEPAKFRTF